ncbi:hypothetical protein [Trueperella pecoris]|uniref:hypothetical protein n=1 Tax=Trueperella pecoris TaxID=2733571 RepID=UPI001ABDFBE6|nr:hypothetical protein [Trueperella pecoris]QTG75425.1 hypothetical protein J4179_09510 [Trueperella pecoris]
MPEGQGRGRHQSPRLARPLASLRLVSHKLLNIKVERDYHSLPPITCYPGQLSQIWTNLITNAAEAMAEQADLADTIRAVNDSDLDHYIAKPCDPAELRATARRMLTDFVEVTGLNPLPHLAVLDAERAMELARDFSVAD